MVKAAGEGKQEKEAKDINEENEVKEVEEAKEEGCEGGERDEGLNYFPSSSFFLHSSVHLFCRTHQAYIRPRGCIYIDEVYFNT